MRCGAKTRNGDPCASWPVGGRTRCRMHGGKTPRGPANANYIVGGIQFLPARMFAAYRDAALDPELMSLRQDLALLDARIIDVLNAWIPARQAAFGWRCARHGHDCRRSRAGDVDGYQEAFADVARLVNNGVGDTAAWRDVGALIEQRRKLVESEQNDWHWPMK